MMIAGILITVLDLTIPTGLVFTKYQNEKQTNNDYPVWTIIRCYYSFI